MYYLYVGFVLFLLGQAYIYSPVATSANFDAEVEANMLNVRAGPGLRYDVLDKLPRGSKVSILDDEVRERGRETNENWTKVFIVLDGRRIVGWVCDRFLDHLNTAQPQVASVEFQLPEPSDSPDLPVVMAPEDPIVETPRPEIGAAEPAIVAPVPAPSPEVFEGEVFFAISGLTSPHLNDKSLPQIDGGGDTDKRLALVVPPMAGKPGVAPEWSPDVALVTPPDMPKKTDPLTYEAIGIDCRRSYFGSSLEACKTEISVEVDLPHDLDSFLSVQVVCEIDYRVTISGFESVETVSSTVEVPLIDGTGSAVAELALTFENRQANVTRVSADGLSCRPAWQ